MLIKVQLHTILQRQTPQGSISQVELELPEGSTLADVLAALEVKLPEEALLLVVNGRMADLDTRLQDGDYLNLMPALSGGDFPRL